MEIAVDTIHYMIGMLNLLDIDFYSYQCFRLEHGYIKASTHHVTVAHPTSSAIQHPASPVIVLNKALMGTIIEAISKCSDEFDDGVHLQVYFLLANGAN